jgi:hypothetical protein
MKMAVFWAVAPCRLVEVYQDDEGIMYLLNGGKLLPYCTPVQPRRQPSSYLETWFFGYSQNGEITGKRSQLHVSCFVSYARYPILLELPNKKRDMEYILNAYKVLVGKSEGKRLLGRSKRR